MSRLAHALTLNVPQPGPGLWARIKAHVARVNLAHARRAGYKHITDEIRRDIGLPPEGIAGQPAHQPDLPFFMQSGFDRR